MDFSGFGSLMGGGQLGNGGLLGAFQRMNNPGAAPQVPSDGAMGPTIGPGAAAPAPAAPAYTPKLGLPKGGLLGILQGQSPQGIMGLLQSMKSQGSPLAGGMPAAGMLSPGQPGSPYAGPVAPQLPRDINPMNQF